MKFLGGPSGLPDLLIPERSRPLSLARRYYPGFLAALFLVLLRIAIGWHFLYEGVTKVYSTPEGRDSFLAKVLPRPNQPEPPFSAEGYLRNATGPLAPYFRDLVPDIDGLAMLDEDNLKRSWERDLERFSGHYQFDEAQLKAAIAALRERMIAAHDWFLDLENRQKISKYRDDLAHIDRVLASPKSLSFERERAYEERGKLNTTRAELLEPINAWTETLHDAWTEIAGAESTSAPPAPLKTKLDWINLATMYGMIAVGLGLILGFLTPLSALGAVGYLTLFYLSMPPWPHLPAGPMQEGHYLYVNKNLIELLACLALACLPTGRWVGLDAVVMPILGRLVGRGRGDADAVVDASPSTNHPTPTAQASGEPVNVIHGEPVRPMSIPES